jgi:hypothetical protein
MKAAISLATLVFAISIARAEAINLTCGGVMHTYNAKHIEGTVSPQATVIDLEQRRMTTPVGDFSITDVSEGSISFGDGGQRKDLAVFGTLDRVTGLMRVFWRRPGDNARMAMYSELNCSAAKRLF